MHDRRGGMVRERLVRAVGAVPGGSGCGSHVFVSVRVCLFWLLYILTGKLQRLVGFLHSIRR